MRDHHFVLRIDFLDVRMQSEGIGMWGHVFAANLYAPYVVPNWKDTSSSLKPVLPTKDMNYVLSAYSTSASNSVVPTVINIFVEESLFMRKNV